jgi:hypothetical protein
VLATHCGRSQKPVDKKALSTLHSHQVRVGWTTAERFPLLVI